MTENKAPEMWEWGIGEKGGTYYDYWAYHKDDEYEVHVWWDRGNSHSVEIIPIKGYDENDDPIYGYAKETCEFPTEDEAIEYACELMEKYA
jgi:hypothetical protein